MEDADDEPSPVDKKANRKKLKEKIDALKMDRRVGKYTSNPDKTYMGIYKAPKEEQQEYRKGINDKIKSLRGQM